MSPTIVKINYRNHLLSIHELVNMKKTLM